MSNGDAPEPTEANGSTPDPSADVDSRPKLTIDQEVGHYIDLWKQSVSVQMHFNDIEWRIRGLALTAVTFAVGAAAVATKDGTRVGPLSLGTLIVIIGFVLWIAFFLVDLFWYHPLLKGTVDAGTKIENEIKKSLPAAGMTAAITKKSTLSLPFFPKNLEIKSTAKLICFYVLGIVTLGVAAHAFRG